MGPASSHPTSAALAAIAAALLGAIQRLVGSMEHRAERI